MRGINSSWLFSTVVRVTSFESYSAIFPWEALVTSASSFSHSDITGHGSAWPSPAPATTTMAIAQWANWDRANEAYGCHWFGHISWPSVWSKYDQYHHLTTTPCCPTMDEFETCRQAPSWHRHHGSRGSQGCTYDPQKLFKPQQLLGNKVNKVL